MKIRFLPSGGKMGIGCWAKTVQLLFQMGWEFLSGPVLIAKGPARFNPWSGN